MRIQSVKVSKTVSKSEAGRSIVAGLEKKAVPPDVMSKLIDYEYNKTWWGMLLGYVTVCLGVLLFFLGVVAEKTTVVASWAGAEFKMTDAAPGALLFAAGAFFVYITRFEVDLT